MPQEPALLTALGNLADILLCSASEKYRRTRQSAREAIARREALCREEAMFVQQSVEMVRRANPGITGPIYTTVICMNGEPVNHRYVTEFFPSTPQLAYGLA